MEQFAHISVSDTHKKLKKGAVKLVDIRDEQSFNAAHIEGAWHLNSGNMVDLLQQTELDTPVIVYCYHGVSSQQAAQYLLHQGFEEVYSMDGGFEAWRKDKPFVTPEASD